MHFRAAVVDDGVHSPRGGTHAEPAASMAAARASSRRLSRLANLPAEHQLRRVNCAAHTMADKSVWLNVDDEDAWVLGTVEGSTDSEVNLLRAHAPDGVSTKTTITMEAYKKLTPVTGDMSVPVHDLCLLEDVNTASLLHTLRQRYAVDDIYTAIGPIVVAVNPYKKVASCSAENFANMKDLDEESIPPHVFRVGLSAYMAMMRTSAQSVPSRASRAPGRRDGELTMNVLAEVSQSSGKTTEQCLEAGIVLEALGNAKTVYNNNSSASGAPSTSKEASSKMDYLELVTVRDATARYHSRIPTLHQRRTIHHPRPSDPPPPADIRDRCQGDAVGVLVWTGG